MNEISRCCRVLQVKHGASLEEVKKAYRDLVQVWHPDRFTENERLQDRVQEQLKEINLAYEYLIANAFQDGFLVEPAEAMVMASQETEAHAASGTAPSEGAASPEKTSDWPEEEVETQKEAAPWNAFWALAGVAVILVGCGIVLYLKMHGHAQNTVPSMANNGADAGSSLSAADTNPTLQPAETSTTKPAPAIASSSSYPFATDVLAAMTFTNGGDWLQDTHLLSPPFAIRAKVKLTDLAELRLHYGLGRVIFNGSDHPKEMRVYDPRNYNVTPVPDQGLLLPNQSQELVWEVSTNKMSVSVNGQVRFQANGDYEGIKGYPGINPYQGPVSVESFILETPRPLEDAPAVPRNHGPIAGDLLSSMVPDENVRVSNEPDGLALRSARDSGNRLMSPHAFRPPFVIRTRAKTDGLNLRLFCGGGEIIFNWEGNPQELRVHDPLSGQQTPVPGKGVIAPNEWHAIIWEIQNTGMTLAVDGQLRYQNRKDYHALEATAGIGPFLSKVTVDYFLVEKK
jgi:hypothetical protein